MAPPGMQVDSQISSTSVNPGVVQVLGTTNPGGATPRGNTIAIALAAAALGVAITGVLLLGVRKDPGPATDHPGQEIATQAQPQGTLPTAQHTVEPEVTVKPQPERASQPTVDPTATTASSVATTAPAKASGAGTKAVHKAPPHVGTTKRPDLL